MKMSSNLVFWYVLLNPNESIYKREDKRCNTANVISALFFFWKACSSLYVSRFGAPPPREGRQDTAVRAAFPHHCQRQEDSRYAPQRLFLALLFQQGRGA